MRKLEQFFSAAMYVNSRTLASHTASTDARKKKFEINAYNAHDMYKV